MGNVHNHGPDEGLGLLCREIEVDGQLKGECLRATPQRQSIDTVMKVYFEGYLVGVARVSHDGQIMNLEIDQLTGATFMEAVKVNLIDGINIVPSYTEAQPLVRYVPAQLSRKEKARLWFLGR